MRFSFRLLPLDVSSSLTPFTLAADADDDDVVAATVGPTNDDDLPVAADDECFDLSRDFERLRSRCSCFKGSTGINLDGDSGAFALCGVDESANNGFSCGRKLNECHSKIGVTLLIRNAPVVSIYLSFLKDIVVRFDVVVSSLFH